MDDHIMLNIAHEVVIENLKSLSNFGG
jgi:hypothetical protein